MRHFLKQMAEKLSRSMSVAVPDDNSQQKWVWPVNSHRHFINTGVIRPAENTTIQEEDTQYAENVEMDDDTAENPVLKGGEMEEGPEGDQMEEDPESKYIDTDLSTRPDIFPGASEEMRI